MGLPKCAASRAARPGPAAFTAAGDGNRGHARRHFVDAGHRTGGKPGAGHVPTPASIHVTNTSIPQCFLAHFAINIYILRSRYERTWKDLITNGTAAGNVPTMAELAPPLAPPLVTYQQHSGRLCTPRQAMEHGHWHPRTDFATAMWLWKNQRDAVVVVVVDLPVVLNIVRQEGITIVGEDEAEQRLLVAQYRLA